MVKAKSARKPYAKTARPLIGPTVHSSPQEASHDIFLIFFFQNGSENQDKDDAPNAHNKENLGCNLANSMHTNTRMNFGKGSQKKLHAFGFKSENPVAKMCFTYRIVDRKATRPKRHFKTGTIAEV